MSMPFDPEDNAISTIEELDPEDDAAGRAQRTRRFHVLEATFGLIIIAGLMAFALHQWWDSQVKQAEYHAGERAWQAEDWQAAREAYLQASGFRDADSKA